MNALTLSLANAIGARLHLHPRAPARSTACPGAGHIYPSAAVDRHAHGVMTCPLCSARVRGQVLGWDQVRVPEHRRLSSVTVRTVGR